jgi:hypothetical protein
MVSILTDDPEALDEGLTQATVDFTRRYRKTKEDQLGHMLSSV